MRLTAKIKQHKRRRILRKEEKPSFQRLAAVILTGTQKLRENFMKGPPAVMVTRTKTERSVDF